MDQPLVEQDIDMKAVQPINAQQAPMGYPVPQGQYAMPPPQQVAGAQPPQMWQAPPPGAQQAMQALSTHSPRHPALYPGRFITSAMFDPDQIKCYYCCTSGFCCGGTDPIFERTYVDVYENRIEQNLPAAFSCFWGCCCNKYMDAVMVVHYDRSVFNKPLNKAGVCNPFPHFCAHGCGCCGDVLALNYPCGLCCPLYNVNTVNIVGHRVIPFLCCWVTALTCGLREGEADRLASVINAAKDSFRVQLATGRYQPLGAPNIPLMA